MRRGSRLALGVVALGSISNCLDPTEIVLEIGTDVSCSEVQNVGIAVGAPGNDSNGFSTVTTNCSSDGGIGSLVVTPSGAGTAIGVRVVMGVDASAEACQPPSYDGCIVARRSIAFVPHTPLHLPIDLQGNCLGVACSPDSTCFNGACVDAGVPCVDNVCSVPDAGPVDSGPIQDVSVPDTGVIDAGTCVPTTSKQLTTAISGMQVPHIARIEGGYAISWVLSSSQLMTMVIDETGVNIVSPFQVTYVPSSAHVDAVGSDGTNVLNVYETPIDGGATLTAVESALDGGVITTTKIQGSGPITGALYDVNLQQFIVGGAQLSSATLFELPAGTTGGQVTGTLPVSGVTVSGTPSLYALSYVDSAGCFVHLCTPSGQGFTCAASPGYSGGQTCTGIRTALSGGVTYVAPFAAQTVSLAAINANVPPVSITSVENASSYQLLATGSSPLHVVWRQAGSIYADTLPTRQSKPTTLGTTPYNSTGAGFDAVADDANLTSFGVVWMGGTTTTPNIMFARLCE